MSMINKTIKYGNGIESELTISSDDNYHVNLPSKYKLVNNLTNNKFKSSLFGSDIGINSNGFINIAIISSLIAVSAFMLMILSFKI